MSYRCWKGVVVMSLVAGCAPSTPPGQPELRPLEATGTPASPAAPNATSPEPVESVPVKPACVLSPATVRLRIDSGKTLPTSTGLDITYAGASHDNYGAAGFDLLISLRFRRGNDEDQHLPSFRDRRTHEVLGHCFRMLDADEAAVLLEVSPLHTTVGEPEPDGVAKPTLEAAGRPPPGGAACTETDENGPLPGGKVVTTGCAPNELCVCEVQAGYSCRGHCAPIQGR